MKREDIWDYVRVVNIRGDEDFQATKDEKVIIGHRGSSVLGNNHPMKSQTMKERDRVIVEFNKDLQQDLEVQGPIHQLLDAIAEDIIENEQKIALECFCVPCDCHLNKVVPVVVKMAEQKWDKKYGTNIKLKM